MKKNDDEKRQRRQERKREQRALITDPNDRPLPPTVMFENEKAGTRTPMINIGGDRLVSLPALIALESSLASPKAQFSAMINAAVALHERASSPAAGGVTIAESTMIFQLVMMLQKAQQGIYDDPRWPEETKQAGRPKSSDAKSRAEQSLIALARLRQRITKCKVAEACLRAVQDLARVLSVKQGMDLTKEFAAYEVKSEDEARPDQRTRRKQRANEPRRTDGTVKLETIALRVENWWKNPRSDDHDHPGYNGDNLRWHSPQDHYSAVLANTAMMFVWATPHEHQPNGEISLTVMQLNPTDSTQPIQPE